MMAGIRSKNTRPEMVIRRALHRLGFRYRLHDRKLPGRPDLAFPKHRAVIFVNGCFWHGHGCHLFKMPATRTEFWSDKINANRNRDAKAMDALDQLGIRHRTVWECHLKGKSIEEIDRLVEDIARWLNSRERTS
jgi:DNA mismatch endonuclease (patch repair protein)